MKHVVISAQASQKCKNALVALGYRLVELPACPTLPAPVAAHPDMLIFIYGKEYLCTADYRKIAARPLEELESLGYTPIISNEVLGNKYPRDVIFNSLLISNTVYGLKKVMSPLIQEAAERHGLKIKNVRQGYTKCSVCKISEDSVITADASIADALSSDGIDVLRISEGGIGIAEYDHGFIGGTSGVDGDRVYFCGDIFSHPDADIIVEFCKKHKKECISLCDEPLFDIGSLFFV